MEEMQVNPFNRGKLTGDILQEWQGLLNVSAEIFAVPAGLITRIDGREIEILLSSESKGNPYTAGYTTHYPDSGWYCERTLKNNNFLLIPNALQDPEWKDNAAAVGLHMISYMGMPLARPDGGLFGTVCFLDNKQNTHSVLYVKLLNQIKRLIELSLQMIFAKDEIEHRDRFLDGLSRIYPICSYCKKVREGATGTWVDVEKYVMDVSGQVASHGVCPQCYEQVMKDLNRSKILKTHRKASCKPLITIFHTEISPLSTGRSSLDMPAVLLYGSVRYSRMERRPPAGGGRLA